MENNSEFTVEDVLSVAKSINKNITIEQARDVLEDYPDAQEDDPTGGWWLVMEELIYNL
jgi:hypothetical protein